MNIINNDENKGYKIRFIHCHPYLKIAIALPTKIDRLKLNAMKNLYQENHNQQNKRQRANF